MEQRVEDKVPVVHLTCFGKDFLVVDTLLRPPARRNEQQESLSVKNPELICLSLNSHSATY